MFSRKARSALKSIRSYLNRFALTSVSELMLLTIHAFQDTAKTNYDAESAGSIIDLNRAGSALMEIVSKPDMS